MSDVEKTTDGTAAEAAAAPEAAPAKPFLSIVKGQPSDQEVAALTVLFAGLAAGASVEEDKGPRNDWGRFDEKLRQPLNGTPGQFLNAQMF